MPTEAVGEEELAKFWSEWTDDMAPLNLSTYRLAARDFLEKFDVVRKS